MGAFDGVVGEILRQIEPTATQREGAKRSHHFLRDKLSEGGIGKRVITSYLSGSYSRDTAITPIDDVDIIFVIDKKFWLDPLESFFEVKPAPEKVLATFAAAIRYRYEDSSLRTQRRSVRLRLNHLDIDVVPAIPDDDNEGLIWVPDRKDNKWIRSGPLLHGEAATAANKRGGGLVKPIIKLAKFWNTTLPENARLKSFTIETMVVRLFTEYRPPSIDVGLAQFLDFVAHLAGNETRYKWNSKAGMSWSFWGCSVPDTAGTESNTAAYVDGYRREKFVKQAAKASKLLAEASTAEDADGAAAHMLKLLRAA